VQPSSRAALAVALVEVRLHFVVYGGEPTVETGPVVSEIKLRIDNLIPFIGGLSLVPGVVYKSRG
jgi:hypothetical protein